MSTCGISFGSNGLTDMETLALFDDGCLDPASVVGSNSRFFESAPSIYNSDAKSFEAEEHFPNYLEASESFDELDAYLRNFPISQSPLGSSMKAHTASQANSLTSGEHFTNVAGNKRPETNLEEDLYFLDMADFSMLNVKSADIADLNHDTIGQLKHSEIVNVEGARTFLSEERKMATNGSGEFATPKVYPCRYCAKKFYNELASRHHHVNHAGKQLRCHGCKFNARTSGGLVRHMEYYHLCTPKRRTTHIWYDCFC